ncbi:MAG TPA: SufE family protein [Acetobacteraceae bacterium]|nr:SufE family protein [Acetobacteraceae bacterium]
MTGGDPFVLPEEASAAEAIAAIAEELSLFDGWEERYRHIIDLGQGLPPFPAAWMNEAHRVSGCQSRVWLGRELRDGRLFLAGASDAAIVSGLVALLLRVYSGRAPDEIAETDPRFLIDLGLIGALSTNRGNGIAAMARRIRAMAREAAGEAGDKAAGGAAALTAAGR